MHLLTRSSGWICRAAAECVQGETRGHRARMGIRQRLMRYYCLGWRRKEARLSSIAAMRFLRKFVGLGNRGLWGESAWAAADIVLKSRQEASEAGLSGCPANIPGERQGGIISW